MDVKQIKELADQISKLCDEKPIIKERERTFKKVSDYLYEVIAPISRLGLSRVSVQKSLIPYDNFITGMFFVPSGNDSTWGKTMPVGNFYNGDRKRSMQAKYIPAWIREHTGKKLSTFFVYNDGSFSFAKTDEIDSRLNNLKIAFSGIPVLVGGRVASYSRDVQPEGYGADKFYSTWHTIIALKDDLAYIFAYKNKREGGAAVTDEIFEVLKPYNLDNAIMLDGGGSFVEKVDGELIISHPENRVIDSILTF